MTLFRAITNWPLSKADGSSPPGFGQPQLRRSTLSALSVARKCQRRMVASKALPALSSDSFTKGNGSSHGTHTNGSSLPPRQTQTGQADICLARSDVDPGDATRHPSWGTARQAASAEALTSSWDRLVEDTAPGKGKGAKGHPVSSLSLGLCCLTSDQAWSL